MKPTHCLCDNFNIAVVKNNIEIIYYLIFVFVTRKFSEVKDILDVHFFSDFACNFLFVEQNNFRNTRTYNTVA